MIKKNDIDLDFDGYIPETREIFLQRIESEDSEIDSRVACNFLKNLRILENASKSPIILHMFSIGGSWYDGMVIYDAIKYSSCKFIIISYGIAASMGSRCQIVTG